MSELEDGIKDMISLINNQRIEISMFRKKDEIINNLLEALQWFIDNDETNEGDEPMPEYHGASWNEINAYWIEGLNKARVAISKAKGE